MHQCNRACTRYASTVSSPSALNASSRCRPSNKIGTVVAHLQASDGSGNPDRPALGHFRLLTEGPLGGATLSDLFRGRRPFRTSPYKLFEIVPGALLEIEAPPAERVELSLRLITPTGRQFNYSSETLADDFGLARITIPYSTEPIWPVRSREAYTVRVGEFQSQLRVSEADISGGTIIRVSPDHGGV